MKCPYCDDPKGIIYVDGVPEPCCDDIITNGPGPLPSTLFNLEVDVIDYEDDIPF